MAPARDGSPAPEHAEPISPTPGERAALQPLDEALHSARHRKVVLSVGDDDFDLPLRVLDLLKHAVHELARGNSVQVIDVPVLLTTQQAADLLNVSRPYLCKLIDSGDIPARKHGSHRKIRLDDLLHYREILDAQRRKSLKKLAHLSEDLGIPF